MILGTEQESAGIQVRIKKYRDGMELNGSGSSFRAAVKAMGLHLYEDDGGPEDYISEIHITAGRVSFEDWNYINKNIYLKKLTIEEGVTVYPVPEGIRFGKATPNLTEVSIIPEIEIIDHMFHCEDEVAACSKKLKLVNIPNATKIGMEAFAARSSLKEIDLHNAAEIGPGAFRMCGLTKAVFKKVRVLEDKTFAYCYALERIEFPGVIKIGNSAFLMHSRNSGIKVREACFPKTREIGNDAFLGMFNMTFASFPEVEVIGERAFAYCENLVVFDAPKVKTIGEDAFLCSQIFIQPASS